MIFYESFYEAIKDMPDAHRLAAYDAIMQYAFTGEEPEVHGMARVVFVMAKPQIDANEKRRQNGSKGGRPKTKETEQKEADPAENKPEKKRRTPEKHRHGKYENVLLTDTELEKLKQEFPDDWQERIENLSEGIAAHGYKYASHLAAIRSWARKDAKKEKDAQKSRSGKVINRFNNFHQRDYDYENLEKDLLKVDVK